MAKARYTRSTTPASAVEAHIKKGRHTHIAPLSRPKYVSKVT